MSDPVEHLTRFGRALRAEGVSVGTGRILEFSRAASLLTPSDLYWAGRMTLIARQEEIPVYDRVFHMFFAGEVDAPFEIQHPVERVRPGLLQPEFASERGHEAQEGALQASRLELLRTKSFAHCTPDELSELARLMARVRMVLPTRRSRRRWSARRGTPDLRRTIRHSFQTAGEPFERSWRDRRQRRRRIVLILDVSGSMTSYSRGLILFAHAALQAHSNWEAFCFATRLTRITKALSTTDPDVVLTRVANEVLDWDGGTRIGESLKRFLDRFGHGGVARGVVVVICSDGLEVGDPVLLSDQMQRLARLAHRVIWLNPLKEHPGYAPLARGMRSALPHVDTFASGHNFASLEALADELAQLT